MNRRIVFLAALFWFLSPAVRAEEQLVAPVEVSSAATPAPWPRARPKSMTIAAYDREGRLLDLPGLLRFIGRADRAGGSDPRLSAIMTASPEDTGYAAAVLEQKGDRLTLAWDRHGRIQLSLPWPVADDGFSTVSADKNGEGFSDGETVSLNEEIAITQYRRFKESLRKRTTDWDPVYRLSPKTRKAADRAKELMAQAHGEKVPAARAKAFNRALQAVSLAWQKTLFEHGLQIAMTGKQKNSLRFGLVLDESLFQRLDEYKRIITAVKYSGANWVRLVFRSNPDDFVYANRRSFNEYDDIIAAIRASGLRIMGTILDTGQWPSALTPQVYAERTKNLVLHYRDQISSWEVGSEINGDWLGGINSPLSSGQVFRIYSAGAAKIKEIDPSLETVATLYWWEGTAPDEEHATIGWLKRYSRMGFGRDLDILAISMQPDENPVGMAFEGIFDRMHQELPDKKLMLGSLGYVEKDQLQGYWWFDVDNTEAAREDLLTFATTASCAAPRSLCGGFWWQTLDQLLPAKGKATRLYRAYSNVLQQMGRDRKSTRLNSSHNPASRMPSSA
jgi:hypothetical protein